MAVPRKALVISVWDGVVSFEDWKTNVRNLMADPDFSKTRMHLTDLRFGSSDGSVGENEIREMVDYIGRSDASAAGRKIAILGGDEFEKSRLFERLAEPLGINVIVFNELARACTWLGIDLKKTERQIEELRASLRASTYRRDNAQTRSA